MSSTKIKTDNSLARAASQTDREVLEEFRSLVRGEETLSCPMDDVYLLQFLRNKKMNTERAYAAVINFWKDRHRLASMHDGLYPSVYEELYKNRFSITFANRDKEGRQIVLWKLANWDPKVIPFLEIVRSNFPILDTIANRQETQLNGAVFIADLTGLSMTHVTALSPSTVQTLLSLTDGFPLCIKCIHFINHPRIFYLVCTCAIPFMKEKMKKRIRFHGYDYTCLHEFVDPEILPECYGGLLTFEEFQEEGFIESVLERERYFRDLFNVHGFKHLMKNYNSVN